MAARAPLVDLGEELAGALRQGAVLTPSRRLAREIAYAVDYEAVAAGRHSWPSPDALSLNAFLTRCYTDAQDAGVPGAEPLLLPDDIALFAFARAVPDRDWLRHIEAFAEAWRIANNHGIASADPRLADTENGRAYSRWAQSFERLAEGEGWLTSAQLPDRLIRLVDGAGRWQPAPATAVAMADLPSAMRRFLTAAKVRQLDMPRVPPATTARLLAVRGRDAGDADPTAQNGDELALAALWARERLAEQPAARIGIVVSSLGPAFTAIERRFGAMFPDVPHAADYVNVSGGVTLAQEPLCRDALELLDFCAGGLDRESLRALGASPFLEVTLPASLPPRANVRGLVARAPTLRRLQTALDAPRGTEAWVGAMRAALDAANWAKAGLDSREMQAKREFEDCLDAFAFAQRVGRIEDWPAAVAGLHVLASRRLFAPQAGHAPIQVVGRDESQGLRFDYLWLAGMHQGGWPPLPVPNPLLPLALQKLTGVGRLSLDEEFIRARRLADGWRHAARHVVASFATLGEGGDRALGRQPSRLVRDLAPVTVADVVDDSTLATNGHPWAVARHIELEDTVDDRAGDAPRPESGFQPGGAAVLQDQSWCPFRAWARHRLDLSDTPARDQFPNEGERGALVHDVLAELLRAFPSSDAIARVEEAQVRKIVDAALAHRDWPPPYRWHEAQRLQDLVVEWLSTERARYPFTVAEIEKTIAFDISGLRLSLRIDRVDEVLPQPDESWPTTGGHLLIDFKTGPFSLNRWHCPRPEDPQLLLYALALERDVRGIAFALVRPGESRLTGVADPAAIAGRLQAAPNFAGKSFDALLTDWRVELTTLAQQFQAGYAAVDPAHPALCQRCHLHALCRVFA